jgi:hypothetical protein
MGEAIRIDVDHDGCTERLSAAFAAAMTRAGGTFEEKEAKALAIANEMVRRWVGDELQRVADDVGDQVVVAGVRYRRGSAGTVRYHTLCGPVAVRRCCYRQVGVHNGPHIVPLELRAGLCENATPALAYSVTHGFATQPPRHYEQEMAAAHRRVPSRRTLERISKRIGTSIAAELRELEPWIRADEERVDGVHSISFGFDRTTAPMAEPIPGAPIPEPRIRRRPAPVAVAYRMAYVATVSLHDDHGAIVSTKAFAATQGEGPNELVQRIAGELIHQRARYRVPIAAIQDGAPELWNHVERIREQHGVEIDAEVLDRYHVDERLAQICELLFGPYAPAHELFAQWRHQLDHSDTAIDRIIRHLDGLVWHSQFGAVEGAPPPTFWSARDVLDLRGQTLSAVAGHVEYFRRNRARMRYATRKRNGLPIGSGATEGACKSLVAMRCKRSGQRWFESGLGPCLSLRALHLSDRLRPAFDRIGAARTASLAAA